MGRNVEVILESGVGSSSLSAVYEPKDLKGKSFQKIIQEMMTKNWQGEEKRASEAIRKQMNSSGGYAANVGLRELDTPPKYQPIQLGEPVETYIRDFGLPEDELRISVAGDETVGKYI